MIRIPPVYVTVERIWTIVFYNLLSNTPEERFTLIIEKILSLGVDIIPCVNKLADYFSLDSSTVTHVSGLINFIEDSQHIIIEAMALKK